MKFARFVFGFSLVVGATLLAGAQTKDVKITAPARKESPSLSDKKSGSDAGPQMDSGRRGWLDDDVQIVSVREEKPDATGRRKVIVRVHYSLVHYPKGVLSLGFNLKSATQIAEVTSQQLLAGEEEIELSATIVPVTWAKGQTFKVSVSLSAEPHPGKWSLLAARSQVMKPVTAPAPAK